MDSYAVITCREGVNIDFNEIKDVLAVFDTTYSGKKFGFIANRLNTYSVNPLAIKGLFSREDLVAGAIVGETMLIKLNAELEDNYVTGTPIRHFVDMNSAVKWILNAIRESRDT